MRDMLGGFPLRDLDFAVEGNALKVAKAVADKAGAQILSIDENRREWTCYLSGGGNGRDQHVADREVLEARRQSRRSRRHSSKTICGGAISRSMRSRFR